MALILADFLVLLHLLFVVFVVAGGFLLLRWPKIAWLQLPAAVWGAYIAGSSVGRLYRIQQRHLPADPAGKSPACPRRRGRLQRQLRRALPDADTVSGEPDRADSDCLGRVGRGGQSCRLCAGLSSMETTPCLMPVERNQAARILHSLSYVLLPTVPDRVSTRRGLKFAGTRLKMSGLPSHRSDNILESNRPISHEHPRHPDPHHSSAA